MAQTLERTNEDVITIRDDEVKKGWERFYLLLSDIHLDNPHCRRDILSHDLNKAKAVEAKAFSFGDLFCAMGGKFDPRRAVANVRPENNNDLYIDSVVNNNRKFLDPWADMFWAIGDGNHETAVSRSIQTDLTARLVETMPGCQKMGYSGFVRFMFEHAAGGNRTERILYFDHGGGGGGEMSKGALEWVRVAAQQPDAHIIVKGHIHERHIAEITRHRISSSGRTYKENLTFVRTSTYKDEASLYGGYHKEKQRPPKPLGGAMLHFYYNPRFLGNVGYRVLWTDGGM